MGIGVDMMYLFPFSFSDSLIQKLSKMSYLSENRGQKQHETPTPPSKQGQTSLLFVLLGLLCVCQVLP